MPSAQPATEFLAAAGWFYECGYVQSTCETHSYTTTWSDYNEAHHYRYCLGCTRVILQSHGDYWDSINGRCTACGRTGFYQDIMSVGVQSDNE
jgi:hypothetical protein